tara:strand:- start:48332 stop:49513 length:1182 start_codon:yes stop_codon:yes gene_type:complete
MSNSPYRTLAVLSVAVLLATAPWLAGSAVSDALALRWQLSSAGVVWLTIATQLGFIAGTLFYSLTNLADQYSPRWVFIVSASIGALFNLGFAYLSDSFFVACCFRFATGLTLAGVYPVGMKIVASWFRGGLGFGLSVMVGALTIGTSLPFLLRALGTSLPWQSTVALASASAFVGAVLVLIGVRDGPYLPATAEFDASMIWKVFRIRSFRLAAFGYFGHMWELYAFWAMLTAYVAKAPALQSSPQVAAILVFAAIALGSVGCVLGGLASRRYGPRRIAMVALVLSFACCALSGFAFPLPMPLLAAFLIVWGMAVVADSPQFSALAVQTCPPEYVGTALTVQNGVGFAITIASIQLLPVVASSVGWQWTFLVLAPGPLLGVWAIRDLESTRYDS